MPNQWDNLFKNEGIWVGSFTSLTPDGTVLRDTPSRLTLERTSETNARFQLVRYPKDGPPEQNEIDFASINRASMFCDDGSFSKGSMQWSSLADFGTEFGLVLPNARLRLVQLFSPGGKLNQFVLIQETREGQTPVVRPPLSAEQLVGTWQGQAITYHRDWYIADPVATTVVVEQQSNAIAQSWQVGTERGHFQATLSGSRLLFNQDGIDYQMLMLPNGGSSLCPQEIKSKTAFRCEIGWLTTPTTRLRLIRSYQQDGTISSLILFT